MVGTLYPGKHPSLLLALYVCLMFFPYLCFGDGNYSTLKKLIDEKLGSDRYTPDLRPVLNQSWVIQVGLSFYLASVSEVDDIKQRVSINGYLAFSWKDELLNWNPSDYGGLRYISPQPSTIWRPKLVQLGIVEETELFKDMQYKGQTQWLVGGKFTASCELDMTSYPFDSQQCGLTFCPVNHLSDQLKCFIGSQASTAEFFCPNDGWDLLNVSLVLSRVNTGDNHIMSCSTVLIEIKRRPEFHVINIILPIILLSLLNNFVFLIPTDCGEKISYGVTVLLAQAVFLNLVSSSVPQSSNNVPALSIYIFFQLIVSVLSVIVAIIIVWMYKTNKERNANMSKIPSCLDTAKRGDQFYQTNATPRTRDPIMATELNANRSAGCPHHRPNQSNIEKWKKLFFGFISRISINTICLVASMMTWFLSTVVYFQVVLDD